MITHHVIRKGQGHGVLKKKKKKQGHGLGKVRFQKLSYLSPTVNRNLFLII